MRAAWWISLGCEALCAAFAFRGGVWPRFTLYLVIDIVASGAMAWPGSRIDHGVYAGYRVISALLLIATAHEAVSAEAKRRKRGDDSLGGIIRWLGPGAGVLLTALLLWLVAPSFDWTASHRGAVAVWRVTSALVAGWLLATWFTAWWVPEYWPPAYLHRMWLLAYVAVPMILSAAMDAAGPGSIVTANYLHLGWAALCYLAWPLIMAKAS